MRHVINRPLAMLVALALAWFPVGPRTSCGCESCDCERPAVDSCCCESPSASPCYAEVLARTCCDSARSAADHCHCEVRRSESPAAPLVRGGHSAPPDPGFTGSVAYPAHPQSEFSLALISPETIRPGPSLRILYCVWRN